jgi:glycosyltransferase involved in cell wall biosynthesis
MQKPPCFIILSPGFAANESDSTVLPFSQSFVLSFRKLYPELKLFVISFQYPYRSQSYLWNGATVIPLEGKNKAGFSRILTWIKAMRTIYTIKKAHQVKGMFSFWLAECALVGQYASRLFKIRQYSWICGQDVKPSNKVLKWLRLNKETIVSMSPNLIEQLNSNYSVANIKVIPSGISQDYFDAIPTGENGYDILGVGSLIELKNYKLFVEMIALLKQLYPNIKTAIIGAGPEEKELQQLIEQEGLQNNVELKGLLKHQDAIACMKASHVFLHTSSYEGQAAVFVEALYCGMQVVCFDVGRLHSDENMFVCRNNDEMLDVVKNLLAKERTERKNILVRSMDDTVKEVVALY